MKHLLILLAFGLGSCGSVSLREMVDRLESDLGADFTHLSFVYTDAIVEIRCNINTGVIEVQRAVWDFHSESGRALRLLHAIGHCYYDRRHTNGASVMNPSLSEARFERGYEYYVNELR